MKARRMLLTAAVILATLSSPVFADRDRSRHDGPPRHHHHKHNHGHYYSPPPVVYVPVLHVVPVIEIVRSHEPRRDCWRSSTTVINHGSGSATGTILGGVIGGVIGHDLARGHHEDLGILAGTLLGATIGHDLSHSTHSVVPATETHCESRYNEREEERVIGYDVTYRYYDRTYIKRTHRHPGSHIQITVNIDG